MMPTTSSPSSNFTRTVVEFSINSLRYFASSNVCSGARADFPAGGGVVVSPRSEEHTSELQSLRHLVCRLLLEKKKPEKHDTLAASPTRTFPPRDRSSADI